MTASMRRVLNRCSNVRRRPRKALRLTSPIPARRVSDSKRRTDLDDLDLSRKEIGKCGVKRLFVVALVHANNDWLPPRRRRCLARCRAR